MPSIQRLSNISTRRLLSGMPHITFGNVGRNTLTGPSFKGVDLAIMKNWVIKAAANVQFRLEVFNLFNHPSFNNPASELGTANFGRISSAGNARKLQGGIKILF
jgi:hypothetical protein